MLIVFFTVIVILIYHQASFTVFLFALTVLLSVMTVLAPTHIVVYVAWSITLLLTLYHFVFAFRRPISTLFFRHARRSLPPLSNTEKEVLSAGTVSWEGNIFSADLDWTTFLALSRASTLNAEEQAFLDGPVHTLCDMINDWKITHEDKDLPPEIWQFLKLEGFFGLTIPKQYGGKQFSAALHSAMLVKVASRSVTVSTTISVPNSLGPAELLLHYGTAQQRDYYLPRLASGEEIPCFALTSKEAGSDAGSMVDEGIVVYGEENGQRTLGIRLNWNKRYITLAPIATLIGLAFKLYDPEHLLGLKENLGITCALIARNRAGVQIGRRHFPLNIAFQNGPIQGVNVFIPLSDVIGGIDGVGKGWSMLMECLAAGRGITLPSTGIGGAKLALFTSLAYSVVRQQFQQSLCHFEGIQELLARMAIRLYIMEAARVFICQDIDSGQKPAVASAIVKYHVTELARLVMLDAMDIHGGKAICLGPRNYLGRFYQSMSIAITVEGANILTRNLIIFGQGALRCHRYLFQEMAACHENSVPQFDRVFHQHLYHFISLCIRTIFFTLTHAIAIRLPATTFSYYCRRITRANTIFALISEISLAVLGGQLKRKERLSAQLGDAFSYIYLATNVMKSFHERGEITSERAIAEGALRFLLAATQQAVYGWYASFPYRSIAWCVRLVAFPFGLRVEKNNAQLEKKIVDDLLQQCVAKEGIWRGMHMGSDPEDVMQRYQRCVVAMSEAEPLYARLKQAIRQGELPHKAVEVQLRIALEKKIINEMECKVLSEIELWRAQLLQVDDFSDDELR